MLMPAGVLGAGRMVAKEAPSVPEAGEVPVAVDRVVRLALDMVPLVVHGVVDLPVVASRVWAAVQAAVQAGMWVRYADCSITCMLTTKPAQRTV